jgi:hypothetical protein
MHTHTMRPPPHGPRPTAVDSAAPRHTMRRLAPTRIQRGMATPDAHGTLDSSLRGDYAEKGGGSPSLTSEEQEVYTGSRAVAAQDRRVQETTDRLLSTGDSPHLPQKGQ